MGGKIEGTIACNSADIEGKFTGTIQVKDLLSVGSTGSVEGDVTISKLIVESGAIFNAKSSMKEQNVSGGLKKITNLSDSREKTA